MRLRPYLLSTLFTLLYSCTDEPNLFEFSVSVKNNTNTNFEIRCFSNSESKFQTILNKGEMEIICGYASESFIGLSGCEKDSLVFEFSNSKGYIDMRLNNNENIYQFMDNKSIFIQGNGFQNAGRDYEFIITQEDFENAFELPE